jgi:hypothetical protein
MRSSRSTSIELSLLVLIIAGSSPVLAQACCAGGTSLSPARLTPHEDAAVALELRGALQQGSTSATGAFRPTPKNTSELDFTQTLVGTLRVLKHAQLSLQVPVSESVRWVPGLGDVGGGLGDLSLAARYDFLLAGESSRVPGLALLVGALLPSGRSPEAALRPLGADTTGQGVWQGSLGLGVEQTVHHVFLQSAALVHQRLPRTVGGVTQEFGVSFSLSLAAGWAFDEGGAVAVTASSFMSLPSRINGALVKGTLQSRTSVGVSGAVPIMEDWRLQGSVVTQLPFGANEPLSTTLSVLLARTWT